MLAPMYSITLLYYSLDLDLYHFTFPSSTIMLRSLAPRGLKVATFRSNALLCRQTKLFSSNRVVCQEFPPGFTPEQAQQLARTPLVQKISKSPKALQQMTKTMDLFVERGYVKPGESPGLMTHFKILTDSKIREQLSESR